LSDGGGIEAGGHRSKSTTGKANAVIAPARLITRDCMSRDTRSRKPYQVPSCLTTGLEREVSNVLVRCPPRRKFSRGQRILAESCIWMEPVRCAVAASIAMYVLYEAVLGVRIGPGAQQTRKE